MKQRVDVLQNDKNIVRSFVRSNVQNRSTNEVGLARNTLFGVALLVGAVSLFNSFI